MTAAILCWAVGLLTGAYLTHALHPLWCRPRRQKVEVRP